MKTTTVSKLFPLLVFASALGILSGCASQATVDGMVHHEASRLPPNQAFVQAIEVQATTGGKETYPWWISHISDSNFTQALIKSLQSHGYYVANTTHARYLLKATIQDVDYPWWGIDLPVTTTINYRLYEIRTNRMILSYDSKAVGVGTFSDSVWAAVRLRPANERSAKNNIGQLMTTIQMLDPSQTVNP